MDDDALNDTLDAIGQYRLGNISYNELISKARKYKIDEAAIREQVETLNTHIQTLFDPAKQAERVELMKRDDGFIEASTIMDLPDFETQLDSIVDQYMAIPGFVKVEEARDSSPWVVDGVFDREKFKDHQRRKLQAYDDRLSRS